MKRIIALFTCIMMIVGIFPQVSFAATTNTELPADTVIAGSKIYTRNYMANNLNEVNTEIRNNPGRVFYIDKDKNIKDEQGNTVTEQQIVEKNIRMLTLYANTTNDVQINGTKYVADENGYFKKIEPSQTSYRYGYVVLDLEFIENTTSKKAINVSIKEVNYVPEAYFYFVSKDNIWSYKKLSEVPGSAQLNKKNLNEVFSLTNIDYLENLYICFYNNAGDLVAKGLIEKITTSNLNSRPVLLYIEYPNNLISSRLTGNISNNGIAATDGDFIYYSNSTDGGKIYKKSIDGIDDYPICNDNAKYINVVGDFIYYSNMLDGGKIYRIKTDGTSRSKINNVLSSYINVVNDDIYYINGKRGNKIYRLKTYNTDPQNEGTLVTTDKATYLVVTEDGKTIYYSNLSDKGRLYSINISTGTRKGYAMSDGNINRGVRYLSISSEGILYASGYDGKLYKLMGEKLYPITIQTSIVKKGKNTSPQIVNDKVGFINAINENAIYYRSTADSGKIYKVDSTGISTKVVDDTATCINIVDDYVFYLKGSKLYIYDIKLQDKPVAAAKFKPEGKIVKADDLDQIPYGLPLPERISVIMDDGSVKDVLVAWDTKNVKGKNGVYTYKGIVIGYGTKVEINAVRYSPMIDEKNIGVVNEEGAKADKVIVKGLQQGDEVNIYNEDDKLLGKVKADKQGTATLANIDLNSAGGFIKVTRTIPGYTPSNVVTKIYDAEAPTIIKVEYVAEKDLYRVTYKGLSEKVSYTLEKVISDTTKETIISGQNKDATSIGSGMYYFEFKDDKNDLGVSDKNSIFTQTDKNYNLKISYQGVQTLSKPYTLLVQSAPNITYNIGLGTFIGTLSNVEVIIENDTIWRNIQDVIADRTLLVGKYYVAARYKPIGNKLPGKTKYVPLVQLPNLAIKTNPTNSSLEKEDILNTKNDSTYVYDAIKNEFNAKYVLNKKESGVYIEISDKDPSLTTNLIFNNTSTSGSSIQLSTNEINENNTVILVINKGTQKLSEQTFKFKAIDAELKLEDVKIDGMYVCKKDGYTKSDGSKADLYVIHSGSFTAPILSGLGSSAPVYGQIKSTIGSSISIDYNMVDFVSNANGGMWVGEKISSDNAKYNSLYDGNIYKLELNYVSKDIRPSITSTKKEVYFKLSNATVPVVEIKDENGKKIGVDKTIYINGVDLKDYSTNTTDTIKWVDTNKDLVQDPTIYKYSFCVEYKPFYMNDFVSKKKYDRLTVSGQLKVTVRNNENGYTQDVYYNFTVSDYVSNLYLRGVDLTLNDGSIISEELDANSIIKLKKYIAQSGDKSINKVKLKFNTVVDEIKDKNLNSIKNNINSDIVEIDASSISINKKLEEISTAETVEVMVIFKTSASNSIEKTIIFTLDPNN